MTKVSVLTPSYRYGRFLGDCLRSVEKQQGVEVEHIVADGGSTDETVSVLSRSTANWISEPDKGQSDALNKALSRASGEWVAWLNADEFLLPGALESLISAARPGVGVVYGESIHTDEKGALLRHVGQHRFDRFVIDHFGCHIPTCAVLIRRELLEEAAWDTSLRVVMDWDLFLGLSRRARFVHVPCAVAGFRVHAGQITAEPLDFAVSPEHRLVRERYDIPTAAYDVMRLRRQARMRHGALKLASGGYRREFRSRSARGRLVNQWLS